MEKITAKQAAEKWQMSERTVQHYCANGGVPGAERFGRTWMIPCNAEKPNSRKQKNAKAEPERQSEKPQLVMPVKTPYFIMCNLYREAGGASSCIEKLSQTPEAKTLFEAWLALYQGNVEKSLELVLPLMTVEADFYGRLSVGLLLTGCAIWNNDAALWRSARASMASVHCDTADEQGILQLWLDIVDTGVVVTESKLGVHSWEEFRALPDDSLPAIFFYYARYLYKCAQSIARGKTQFYEVQNQSLLRMYPFLVEPLVAFAQRSHSLFAEIGIRLLCAAIYYDIDMNEQATHHLDIALELAVADKLYGFLAESRELLHLRLDERLEIIDPEGARAVKKIYKEKVRNWLEMHNKSSLPELSDRQKQIARLAALGLSNDEIASRLHLSVNTVKTTVSMIMNKTGITKRTEFMNCIY